MRIIIKNASVYCPVNNIAGDCMDVLIEKGSIVEKFKSDEEIIEIDAEKKVLMSGGVDIHTHVAGGLVNTGRLMRPEDKTIFCEGNQIIRSGSGFSVPTTFLTGYGYALLGYSFLLQPTTPAITARHTHEELDDIPLMDKAALLLLGNNYLVADYIAKNSYEKLRDYVAWMLSATKTYGIKAVNPGGFLSWLWGVKRMDPHDEIPKFNITPADIIKNLEKVAIELELPHPIHLHLNSLGYPGNYSIALETMKLIRNKAHLTHMQFSSYGGDSWENFESKAEEVIKEINSNNKISFDIGQITLDNTTTMTSDAPFEQHLHKVSGNKWASRDVELECGGGVVPYNYSGKNPVNSVQWAIGLELALLTEDLSKLCLSTDHPNAGPFTRYPRVISWLMSRNSRKEFAKRLNNAVSKRSILFSIDREFNLYEIATITRASPAKILGIDYKGIVPDAKADLVLYDLNPEETNSERIERAFGRAKYTILNGEIVVNNGRVSSSKSGKTIHVKRDVKNPEIENEIELFFRQRYSVGISNYKIDSLN